jgi:fatty acid amide hydrolase
MTESKGLHLLSATEAAAGLANKAFSSVELTQALLARIHRYDRSIKAFTEVLERPALEAAAASDSRRARGSTFGALDGVPISIKESIEMRDHPSTLGIASRMTHRAGQDAAIVQAMRDCGAVIVGRTNVAQALLSFECRNPVYGQCVNPRKDTHSPGGSSGGEAAALAYGASMLGIGTDIGGSIRLPAHFSGVVGFKPTQDRWPNRGLATVLVGQEGVRSQCGPMARSVDDLLLALECLSPDQLSALDGRVPPLPWRSLRQLSVKNLRVAVLRTPVVLPAARSVWRAVDLAADALREQGAVVFDWNYDALDSMVQSFLACASADGGNLLRAALDGSSIDVTLRSVVSAAKLRGSTRAVIGKLASTFGQEHASNMLSALGERTVNEFWQLVASMRQQRLAFERAVRAEQIDVLLTPPCATAAVPHGFGAQFAQAAAYTMVFNVTHGPAGVVPVTTVRADELDREWSADLVLRRAAKVDSMSLGLPVGVQAASVAWRDEEVLAVMAAIERGVREHPMRPVAVVDP